MTFKFMKPTETARCVMFVIDVADRPGTIEEQREALKELLEGYSSFKLWAFVLHDRDEGSSHWQGVVRMDKNIAGEVFAARLDVEGVMKLEGGRRAVTNALQYLTHESQPSKAQYPRSEIVAAPGWNWEAELDAAIVQESARGSTGRRKIVAALQEGRLTADEAIRRGGNERATRVARARYLCELGSEDLPALRVNFYLRGPSHPCLEQLAHALARTLAPDGRFYRFNGRDVDEYDGQSVVVTNSRLEAWGSYLLGDCYVPDVVDGPLGGARELFAMLAATPTPHAIPTKHGKTQLIQSNTVIVGEEPFEVFRDRLERLYDLVVDDHRDQSYLSLPVFVPVDTESFSVQVNERFALGRGEFDQFIAARDYTLDLGRALADARHVPEEQRARVVRHLEEAQTAPIREAGALVAESMRPADQLTTEDVLGRYADLGKPVIEGEIA